MDSVNARDHGIDGCVFSYIWEVELWPRCLPNYFPIDWILITRSYHCHNYHGGLAPQLHLLLLTLLILLISKFLWPWLVSLLSSFKPCLLLQALPATLALLFLAIPSATRKHPNPLCFIIVLALRPLVYYHRHHHRRRLWCLKLRA